jgi:flagella basal body P-ring formation protein FlgA
VGQLLAMSRPTYEFRIADTGKRIIGRASFNVTVYENGKVTQQIPVLAEVLLAKPAILAAGNINRGQTIERDDLVAEEQIFDHADEMTSLSMDQLVGQQAKRLIRKGSLIRSRDVESVPLIQRNDLVTVWVRWDSLVVKSSARAMESGCLGDVIPLRNEASRETFTARIVGQKKVELIRSSKAAAMAMAEGVR